MGERGMDIDPVGPLAEFDCSFNQLDAEPTVPSKVHLLPLPLRAEGNVAHGKPNS